MPLTARWTHIKTQMLRTKFTDDVGGDHPVVCGGMTGLSLSPLIAAVANAGTLGFSTALTQPTPEDLAKEIARGRGLAERPFGVISPSSRPWKPVPYDEYRAVIVESGHTGERASR